MGGSSQFSQDSTVTGRKKLWNPSKVLEIDNPDLGCERITCNGYAPSQGRRCRNPLNAANRAFIDETLSEMAYLQPDSSAVTSRLRKIVGPALCVRYHQNQSETVLNKWQERVKQLRPRGGERTTTTAVQKTKSRDETPNPAMEDLQEQLREMREQLAELHEEFRRSRRQNQDNERRENERKDAEKERQKTEQQQRERLEKVRKEEAERLDKEKQEKVKREEAKRLEKEKKEKEEKDEEDRQEKERQDRERKAREQREHNENIRQRAQRRREEKEQAERDKAQKEREEWDILWTQYKEKWEQFCATPPKGGKLSSPIPWPIKSGIYNDVRAPNVKEFFTRAVPEGSNLGKLMVKESFKWHPDKTPLWIRDAKLTVMDEMAVDMVCRVVTGLIDESKGK